MRDTVLGVPVTKIRALSALSWPPLYGTYHLHQDPGERYLGPWAQYTFPQKEHLGHNWFSGMIESQISNQSKAWVPFKGLCRGL